MTPRSRIVSSIALTVVTAVLLIGCTSAHRSFPDPPAYWPTDAWRTSTPEAQGIHAEGLVDVLDYIRDENVPLHSLLVIRHGYVVMDAYFYPYDGRALHDVASVTKSVTTTLIGIALDRGYLPSLEHPVRDVLTQYDDPALWEDKTPIRIRDFVSMTSGLDCGYQPAERELQAMRKSDAPIRYVLDLPRVADPGAVFSYCSPGMHLLSGVVSSASGRPTHEFAREFLFEPLGIRDVEWPADRNGLSAGWGELRLHPHDMAKIGFLFLHGGQWGEEQVVSRAWVTSATSRQIRVDAREDVDYGYGWWILEGAFEGVYEAQGRGEQSISVWPEKDLIVVFTGAHRDRSEIAARLAGALASDRAIPNDEPALDRLNERLEQAKRPPEPAQVNPARSFPHEGRFFEIEPNALGLQSLSLSRSSDDEALFTLTFTDELADSGRYELPVGLDGLYRIAEAGPAGGAAGMRGAWLSDTSFVLDYHEPAGVDHYRFTTHFSDEQVVIQFEDLTGYYPAETMRGIAAAYP